VSLVHVKLEPVAGGAAEDPRLLELLCPEDHQRIAKLGFAPDRDRAATARAVARTELGRLLGVHPRHVPLLAPERTGGRAVVDGTDLGVSWAHSGGWIAVALAHGHPVGIDIEQVPERLPVRALERMGVRSLEEFVAREAVGKLSGGGLTGPWPPGVTVRWLEAPDGYLAGVAAPGAEWSIARLPTSDASDAPVLASAVAVGLWAVEPRPPALPLGAGPPIARTTRTRPSLSGASVGPRRTAPAGGPAGASSKRSTSASR